MRGEQSAVRAPGPTLTPQRGVVRVGRQRLCLDEQAPAESDQFLLQVEVDVEEYLESIAKPEATVPLV